MTWRRRVASVFAALVTATAILLAWPDGPRWAVPLDPFELRPVDVPMVINIGGRTPRNRPLGFSPDGGTVFAVDRLAAASAPPALRSWDVATGRPRAGITLPPSVRTDTILRLSPDGRRLLVWNARDTADPTARFVLDLAAGRTVCAVTASGPGMAPVAFLAGGRRFWTAEANAAHFFSGRAEVFDATTGDQIAEFGGPGGG